MWEDPIVLEVRLKREELAARFDFDVHAIFEDMRKRQSALKVKLVRIKKRKKTKAAALGRNSTALHSGR